MTALTPNAEDGPRETAAAAAPEAHAPALHVGSPNHCASCGAELALDQRYCVECGTRRGHPRFVIAGQDTAPAAAPATQQRASGSRLVALLAVVAVLLALGIGVLIGSSSSSIKQPVRVTITGGSVPSGSGKSGSSGSGSTRTGGSKTGGSSTQNQNFFGG